MKIIQCYLCCVVSLAVCSFFLLSCADSSDAVSDSDSFAGGDTGSGDTGNGDTGVDTNSSSGGDTDTHSDADIEPAGHMRATGALEFDLIHDQRFILHAAALAGDVVGEINTVTQEDGENVTYEINTPDLSVDNAGVVRLVNPTALGGDFSFSIKAVSSTRNMVDDASYDIVVKSSPIVYIDPEWSGCADGTLACPLGSWLDVSFADDTTYLQKRGTTDDIGTGSVTTKDILIQNVFLGSYGDASQRPIIRGNSVGSLFNLNIVNSSVRDLQFDGMQVVNEAVRIQGSTIEGTPPVAGTVTIDNCVIEHTGGAFIVSYRTMIGLQVLNLTAKDSQTEGLFLKHNVGIEVGHSRIVDINQAGVDGGGGGDSIQTAGYTGDIHIHHNIVKNDYSGWKHVLILGGGADGLPAMSAIIEHNLIVGLNKSDTEHNHGLYGYATIAHLIFRYNTVRNCEIGVLKIRGSAELYGNKFIKNGKAVSATSVDLDHIQMYNNLFFDNVETDASVAASASTLVTNNIFFSTEGGHSFLTSNSTGSVTIDNNLYSGEVYLNDTTYFIEPSAAVLFVSPGNEDYHLAENSPALNVGISVPMTTDIVGKPVPSTGINLGPYQ